LPINIQLDGLGSSGIGPIAVDTLGQVTFTAVATAGYPTTANAYSKTVKGINDIVLTKLDSNGSNLIYSTYLGGNLGEIATDIVQDRTGAIYLTGITTSPDYPTSP